MPFTFLAHQAPVLPLKLRWPRAFAGTALVLGSIAPDCEYFLRGQVLTTFSHKLWSQPLFCLPLTLLLVFLVRRLIIGPLAAHLPALPQRGPLGALGRLHLGDYQSLDGVPPGYWPRAVVGALIGALSHLLLDDFTHDTGWSVTHLALLQAPLPLQFLGQPLPLYRALQFGGTAVCALLSLALLLRLGQRRLLRPAAPPPLVPTPRSHRALWGSLLLSLLGGALLCGLRLAFAAHLWTDWWGAPVVMPDRTPLMEGLGVLFCHLVTFGFLGLCLGCWRARALMQAAQDVRQVRPAPTVCDSA